MYIREAVRKAYYRDEKSIRRIVRELGIARNTVRKILLEESASPAKYRLSKPKPKPVLDSVLPVIEAWMESDLHAPKKQRHTARRIFQRGLSQTEIVHGKLKKDYC